MRGSLQGGAAGHRHRSTANLVVDTSRGIAMSNPIRRGAGPATEFDLSAFEGEIGHSLPAEYRASLLASNGGVPRRRSFRYTLASGKPRKARVVAFAPTSAEGWAEFGCRPLPELWEVDGRELVDGTIAVGNAETDVNDGTIRLGVAGDRAGRVFFRPGDTARGQIYLVAEGWAEFIDGLKHADKPEPWDEPIEDGDADLLRKWLAQYRRKWDDGASRIDIERKAIEEDQAEILDMLVAEWEFEPASIVEEALDAHRLDIAMRFLPAAAEGSGLPDGVLNRAGPYFWHAPALIGALIDAGADASMRRAMAARPCITPRGQGPPRRSACSWKGGRTRPSPTTRGRPRATWPNRPNGTMWPPSCAPRRPPGPRRRRRPSGRSTSAGSASSARARPSPWPRSWPSRRR
jgi:hypothetical protein